MTKLLRPHTITLLSTFDHRDFLSGGKGERYNRRPKVNRPLRLTGTLLCLFKKSFLHLRSCPLNTADERERQHHMTVQCGSPMAKPFFYRGLLDAKDKREKEN